MLDDNMEKELSESEIKRINKEYIEHHGIGSFFGLLSELFPKSVDQEDLRKHEENMKIEREGVEINSPYLQDFNLKSDEAEAIKQSGMYDPEDLPAVLEDYANKKEEQMVNERPKMRTLENPNVPVSHHEDHVQRTAPNPWGDVEIVEPGYFKTK